LPLPLNFPPLFFPYFFASFFPTAGGVGIGIFAGRDGGILGIFGDGVVEEFTSLSLFKFFSALLSSGIGIGGGVSGACGNFIGNPPFGDLGGGVVGKGGG